MPSTTSQDSAVSELTQARPEELDSAGAIIQFADTPDSTPSKWNIERAAAFAMWFVIAATVFCNVVRAAARPFWFDELCTIAVARQPSVSSLWEALRRGEDSSPLLYGLIERFCGAAFPNEHIAYRIASIVGFGCILWCIFVFVRTRAGGVYAFPCALIPILTPLYRAYAIDARSYAIALAFVAIALVCYQRAPRKSWVFLMALSLMIAQSLHYYAFFGFVAFALAEGTWTARWRAFRWSVWLALASGFVPLAAAWPMLHYLRQFNGEHFWGKPVFATVERGYNSLFGALLLGRSEPHLGLLVAVGLSLVVVCASFVFAFSRSTYAREGNFFHEPLLAVGLLNLPFVGYAATKIADGPFADRYFLGIVVGIAFATGYILRQLRFFRIFPFLLAAVLMFMVGRHEVVSARQQDGFFATFESPAAPVERLLTAVGYPDLPVVVSDGQEYTQLAYYASPDWAKRFVALVDPAQEISYTGNDSLDRQMLAVRSSLGLRLFQFQDFASTHSRFLLYSGGKTYDWWPRRLIHDGYKLRLVSSDGFQKIYLVDAPAPAASKI